MEITISLVCDECGAELDSYQDHGDVRISLCGNCVNELECDIDDLKNEKESLKTDIEKLEDEFDDLKNEKEELKEENDSLKSEIEVLKKLLLEFKK